MKRFFLVSIVGIAMLSCNNEKIETNIVKTPEPFVTLSYNVSTSSTYEPFGIDDYKNKWLGNSYNYQIGVFTYVYNSMGERVDSAFSTTKTFAQIQQSFKLPKGSYTIVTAETLVNGDYNNESDYWTFVNTEKLTTSEMKLYKTSDNLGIVGMDGVIGYSSKIVNLDSDLTETASPSPLGAIVSVEAYKFNESNFTFLTLNTKNRPIGLKLNPNLNRDERYSWEDYTDETTWEWRLLLGGEKLADSYSAKIYLLESGNITWCFGPTTWNEEIEWFDKWRGWPSNSGANATLKDGGVYYAGIIFHASGNSCSTFWGDNKSEYLNWLLEEYSKTSSSRGVDQDRLHIQSNKNKDTIVFVSSWGKSFKSHQNKTYSIE